MMGLKGRVLPPYSKPSPGAMRRVYAVEAKSNPTNRPLKQATVALFRDSYKLIRYLGGKLSHLEDELYDLSNNPEEMNNLVVSQAEIAFELGAELEAKLQQVNQPYE